MAIYMHIHILRLMESRMQQTAKIRAIRAIENWALVTGAFGKVLHNTLQAQTKTTQTQQVQA